MDEKHHTTMEAAHIVLSMYNRDLKERGLATKLGAGNAAKEAYTLTAGSNKCTNGNAHGAVFKTTSDRCYVAFKGSDLPGASDLFSSIWNQRCVGDVGDWCMNLDGHQVSEGNRKVRRGFRDYYNRVNGANGGGCVQKMINACAGKTLVFTGHSLGGATAAYAKLKTPSGQIVTFSAPPIFKKDSSPSWTGIRLWHENDPVPNGFAMGEALCHTWIRWCDGGWWPDYPCGTRRYCHYDGGSHKHGYGSTKMTGSNFKIHKNQDRNAFSDKYSTWLTGVTGIGGPNYHTDDKAYENVNANDQVTQRTR
jgi:hypothetical protein